MAPQPKQPNLYHLSGDGIHVTYATETFIGKPQLTYQDAHGTKHFIGDQIKVEPSRAGTLVTVVLQMTPDAGSTTFTLLIPRVTLGVTDSASVQTIGIVTVHKFWLGGIPIGQDDLYTVHKLEGTASHVIS
jgi:hypothetical protein